MCVACWTSKAIRAQAHALARTPTHTHPPTTHTHTHTQKYVILIAFPRQQSFCERTLMLRYTYIACLVVTKIGCVYCTVRAEPSHIIRVRPALWSLINVVPLTTLPLPHLVIIIIHLSNRVGPPSQSVRRCEALFQAVRDACVNRAVTQFAPFRCCSVLTSAR